MNKNSDNIFWINHNDKNVLATKTQNNYEICKPYQNKLAASIINGLEILPITQNSKILMLENSFTEVVTHISNMIGENGKCFILTESKSNEVNLIERLNKTSNISVVSNSLTEPENFSLSTHVDVLYIDIIDTNLIENILKISELCLNNSGYLLLILPTDKISILNDGSYPNENIFRKKLKNNHDIIQEINLTDFFKNSTLFLCKKK
tara:strand:+ start:1156 stop:1776 length:621 start_codon:yes stop_codon:yes gene_type:complete